MNLQIGKTFSLDDGNYTLVGVGARAHRFRNEDTGEYRVFELIELARLLNEPVGRNSPRAAELADYDRDSTDATLLDREAHILEVIEGRPLLGGEPRGEYAPSVLLSKKIALKVKELNQTKATEKARIAERTFERWISNYRKYGRAGLIDARATRNRKPLEGIDPRLIDAILRTMKAEKDESTGTAGRFILRVESKLNELYPGQEVKLPSERTLRSYVQILGKGRYTLDDAKLRRTASIGAHGNVMQSRPAIKPGHEVQIDSSPFDGWVIDYDGKRVRVVIDLMYDKFTGSIIGIGVVPKASKGIDHALMLARCFVPHELRPVANWDGPIPPEMPWAKYLTAERAAECDTSRPFIVPDRVLVDNGADYVSAVFQSACALLEVDITLSSPGTPTDKPHVERAFDSIKTLLIENIPGFTGGSVEKRGKGIEKVAGLLDIFTLQTLLERWVSIVWQNRKHEGLRDPYDPSLILTPNMAYLAMFDLVDGFVPVPLGPDWYIKLLPIQNRKILRDGIEINRRQYDSPKLGPFRELAGPSGRGTRDWQIRYDPYNPAAIWVADPDTGEWIQCDWKNNDVLIRPFTQTARDMARTLSDNIIGLTDAEAKRLAIEMVAATPTAKANAAAEAKRNEMNIKLREQKGVTIRLPESRPADTETDDDSDFVDFDTFA